MTKASCRSASRVWAGELTRLSRFRMNAENGTGNRSFYLAGALCRDGQLIRGGKRVAQRSDVGRVVGSKHSLTILGSQLAGADQFASQQARHGHCGLTGDERHRFRSSAEGAEIAEQALLQ